MLALDAGYHVLCYFAALAFGLGRTFICLKRRRPIRVTKCTNEFSFLGVFIMRVYEKSMFNS